MSRASKPEQPDHLRSGLIYLVAWIGVVVVQVAEFTEGGLLQILSRIKDGDLFPLVLISSSVVLLALAIRSFVLHFRSSAARRDQGS